MSNVASVMPKFGFCRLRERAYVQALGVPPQQAEGMFQDMSRTKDALLIL